VRQDVEVLICREQMDDLADKEGVAIGPCVDPVDECPGGGDIARSGDEISNLRPRETAEANVVEPLGSCHLRQGAGEQLGRCPVAATCCRHDQHARVGKCPRHKTQQQKRRRVGGMQILQHEHDGLGASLLAQEGCDGVEEPETLAFGIGGERPRQVGAQLTQFGDNLDEVRGAGAELAGEQGGLRFAYEDTQALDPGPICRSTARFPAPTGQHPSIPLCGAYGELLSKRSLADPRFATDQEQRAAALLKVV